MDDDRVFAEIREARQVSLAEIFNPAYRVSRCGQLSAHGPHVVEHGPDQPRNCPGGPETSWTITPAPAPSVHTKED